MKWGDRITNEEVLEKIRSKRKSQWKKLIKRRAPGYFYENYFGCYNMSQVHMSAKFNFFSKLSLRKQYK